jgi:hypothetical protein
MANLIPRQSFTYMLAFVSLATITYEDPHTAGAAIKWFHDKEFHGHVRIFFTVLPDFIS